MRIALLQAPAHEDGRLERLSTAAADAATARADLLIAPEMFLTGYAIGPDAIRARAQPADGAACARVAGIAREYGLAILFGYAESDGAAIYNAAQLVDRDGHRCANHRKTHLFGALDRAAFAPGARITAPVDVCGLRIGILICYEIEFPECVRTLALAGAELIAVPTALMHPYGIVATTLIPARAFENQVYVAYANQCGSEGELHYTGLSTVVAPDGRELARAGGDAALLIADLDPARIASSRARNPYLTDRRPTLYAAVAAGDGRSGSAS